MRLSHAAASACFAYLRLLDFRDRYYSRRWSLNHLSSDGFDCGNDGLFDPRRSFLHGRTFGLGLGNRLRLRSLACLTAFSSVFPQFCTLLYF